MVNVQSQASLSQSRTAPIPRGSGGGGLINKTVASTGPQQIHIDTLVGNMHIGDVINISATTSTAVHPAAAASGSGGGRDDREEAQALGF